MKNPRANGYAWYGRSKSNDIREWILLGVTLGRVPLEGSRGYVRVKAGKIGKLVKL